MKSAPPSATGRYAFGAGPVKDETWRRGSGQRGPPPQRLPPGREAASAAAGPTRSFGRAAPLKASRRGDQFAIARMPAGVSGPTGSAGRQDGHRSREFLIQQRVRFAWVLLIMLRIDEALRRLIVRAR